MYIDELAGRALKLSMVFDDNLPMGILVEDLNNETLRGVQPYLSTHRSIRVYALISHAISFYIAHITRKREYNMRRPKKNDPADST